MTTKRVRRNESFPIYHLFLEIFSVLLGVLIALGVNEWRAKQASLEMTRSVLDNIRGEIFSNRAGIEADIEANEEQLSQIMDSMAELKTLAAESGENGAEPTIGARFGFSQELLSRTAWDTALLTQAVQNMDLAMMQELSGIYQLQDVYMQQGSQALELLGSLDFQEKAGTRASFRVFRFRLQTSQRIGRDLIKAYSEFLDSHGLPPADRR